MHQHLTRIDIEALIPHRKPMLLLDEVQNWHSDESITATATFTEDAIFFQGHFPSYQVLPGVITLEAMAQAAAVLTSLSRGLTAENASYLFVGVNNLRFRSPILPNQKVTLHITHISNKLNIYTFQGTAKVDEKIVLEGQFTAKLTIKE